MIEYLREFNIVSILLRLFLACLCGIVLGINRERRGQAAGIRTYYIVCLGATTAMLLGQYFNYMIDTSWALQLPELGLKTDVARIGAQVISGCGFLGAGCILLTDKNNIKGLTSAASMWACACLGLAIGIGFYELVLVAFIMIFIVLNLFSVVNIKTNEKMAKTSFEIQLINEEQLSKLLETIAESGVNIVDYDYINDDKTLIDVKLILNKYQKSADLINIITECGIVQSVKKK